MPNEGNGRHLPPSDARLAAAARDGMFPRSPVLALGAALAAFAAALGLSGRAIGAALEELVRGGLESAVRSRPDPATALVDTLLRGATLAAPLVLAPACAALVAAVVPALWARRFGRGATSTPLPERPPRTPERAVLYPAAALVAAIALAWGFAEVDAAAGRIVEPIAAGIFAAGIALLVAGLADLALQRTRLVEALSLTRSEARREQRTPATARRLRRAP